jgi:chromosome segregation ATPase
MQDRICNIAKKNAENLAEIEEVVLPGNNADSRAKVTDRMNGIIGAITRLENDKNASESRLLSLGNQLEIANNKIKELENDISRADNLLSEFDGKIKKLTIDIPIKKIEGYVPKPDTDAENRQNILKKFGAYRLDRNK